MRMDVNGIEIHASTGGKSHVSGQPFLFFLHGSGQSRLTWTQQVRSFAYAGYNVVAPDFPGHGLSSGEPIENIEAMADWVVFLMGVAGVQEARFIGHSQGCLVALELCARYRARVIKAVFIAGAAAVPVNEALVSMAETNEPRAIAAMMSWGSGLTGHKFDHTVPGASHIGAGMQLMSSNRKGALAADLKACNAYSGGLEAAQETDCPTLCILAEKDKMTPLQGGLKLANTLTDNQLVLIKGAGHMLPPENPREVNEALRGFL